ncbi:MAG: signal peptide peptidase SppA [Deltaproteobacteria bacterium]|nr:signal peptide peptidase SppA [Deltaproteobacteria bacterium]
MKRLRWILLLALAAGFFLIYSPDSGNLAVVKITGGIFEPDPVVRRLELLRKEEKVKAVVLRVDSPGGTVGASQEIHEAVKKLRESKKVVASFGSVAASGGYYLALPSHKIFANAGTVTGSIGVRMEYVNMEELLRWAKIHPMTLKSGSLKDAGSSIRTMSPEEKAYLEEVLKKMHHQFMKAVAEGRALPAQKVEQIADGRIYTGEEAKELGLIDEIGNLPLAIEVAARLSGIEGEPDVFYPSIDDRNWIEKVLGEAIDKIPPLGKSGQAVTGQFVYLY